MLGRKYKIVSVDFNKQLNIEFDDESLQILSDYFNMELIYFSDRILCGLDTVLFHDAKEYGCWGKVANIELNRELTTINYLKDGNNVLYSTNLQTIDFYKLVKEFLYLKKILEKGKEDIFPLELDDGQWLI